MCTGECHCENSEDCANIVKIDILAPTFTLNSYNPESDNVEEISLENYRGKWVVLFFYPGDFTFVCPTELKDIADAKPKFDELGVKILAGSTDSPFCHRAWTLHEGLMKNFPYTMFSDANLGVSHAYGVLNEDGTSARGTFIIDPKGICRGIEITSGPLGRNSDELIRKIEALKFMEENPGTACPAKWAIGSKALKPSVKISGKVAEELE